MDGGLIFYAKYLGDMCPGEILQTCLLNSYVVDSQVGLTKIGEVSFAKSFAYKAISAAPFGGSYQRKLRLLGEDAFFGFLLPSLLLLLPLSFPLGGAVTKFLG